jgi:multisubunit Na+/H+ antiporter MnhB subunit
MTSPEGSPILRMVAWFTLPLTLLVAGRIFLQGHNLPGGGFIAGVMAAAAGTIYLLAFGTKKAVRVVWWQIAVVGLLISLATGTVPLLLGKAYMDNTFLEFPLPLLGAQHLPTATFFDLGVFLIVVGTLMTIFVELSLEKK